MNPVLLLAAAAAVFVLAGGRGGASAPAPAPAPGGGTLPLFVPNAGASWIGAVFGAGSAFESSRRAAAAGVGAAVTGPQGGRREPRSYVLNPAVHGDAVPARDRALYARDSAVYPSTPEIDQALLSPTPFGSPVRAALEAINDGDGVLWLPYGPNDLARMELRALLIREWQNTGQTLEASRALWGADWPRMVKSGAGWRLEGIGGDRVATGGGYTAEVGARWTQAFGSIRAFFAAQNAARPGWNLGRVV